MTDMKKSTNVFKKILIEEGFKNIFKKLSNYVLDNLCDPVKRDYLITTLIHYVKRIIRLIHFPDE